MPTDNPIPSIGEQPAAIKTKLMDGLAEVPVFAAGIDRSVRTVSNYIASGMPTVWIGRVPYVDVDPAVSWLRTRRERARAPRKPGRPAKARAQLIATVNATQCLPIENKEKRRQARLAAARKAAAPAASVT